MTFDSEANTQAEFYHVARTIGLRVALEVSSPIGRFDIVVLTEDATAIICIVECKKTGHCGRRGKWQIKRYEKAGVPVYLLDDFDEAESLARSIKERRAAFIPVLLDTINAITREPRAWRKQRRIERTSSRIAIGSRGW
jgi:hypothetical protein